MGAAEEDGKALEVFQVTKGKQHELKDALKNIMHQSPHQTETENAAASVLQVSGSKWVGLGSGCNGATLKGPFSAE